MNIDYIRAKCKLLHGATPEEREQIFMNIGICAGLMSAQSGHLSAQKRDEIKNWLKVNAIGLRLPFHTAPLMSEASASRIHAARSPVG